MVLHIGVTHALRIFKRENFGLWARSSSSIPVCGKIHGVEILDTALLPFCSFSGSAVLQQDTFSYCFCIALHCIASVDDIRSARVRLFLNDQH